MSSRHRGCSLLIAGAMAAAGAGAIAQTAAPGYRWTKGETVRYRVTQESVSNMSGLPGVGDMTVNNTVTQVLAFAVQDVAADGTATLINKVESVRLDAGTPMGTFTYDSTSTTPVSDPMMAPLADIMSVAIGQPITIVMGADGAVQKIEGADKILEKVRQKAGAGPMAGQMGLDTMFGDAAMKGGVTLTFPRMPARSLKPGDVWNEEFKMPSAMGDMTIARALTVAGTESLYGRNVTKATAKLTLKLAPNPTASMGPGGGDGAGDGEVYFDPSRGRLIRSVMRYKTGLAMSIPSPDGTTISVTGTQQTTATADLIEK